MAPLEAIALHSERAVGVSQPNEKSHHSSNARQAAQCHLFSISQLKTEVAMQYWITSSNEEVLLFSAGSVSNYLLVLEG